MLRMVSTLMRARFGQPGQLINGVNYVEGSIIVRFGLFLYDSEVCDHCAIWCNMLSKRNLLSLQCQISLYGPSLGDTLQTYCCDFFLELTRTQSSERAVSVNK